MAAFASNAFSSAFHIGTQPGTAPERGADGGGPPLWYYDALRGNAPSPAIPTTSHDTPPPAPASSLELAARLVQALQSKTATAARMGGEMEGASDKGSHRAAIELAILMEDDDFS